jgi:tetrahydromethanopterin S-methyltransferase subunit A
MDDLLIVGRLHSENKGIDKIIQFSITHPQLKYIVMCGKDASGHCPGSALLNLMNNGVDGKGKIIGSVSPSPFVLSDIKAIEQFKKQITLIDMRNCLDVNNISETVHNLLV